jgi:transmembrane sensor
VFLDGSKAVALSPDSRVAPLQQGPARVVAQLDRGAARFEVVKDAAREFTVQAGSVEVKVLGTVFTVAHEGPRVHVAVMLGRVEVNWGSGSTILMQDGEGVFPPPSEVEAPVSSARADAGSSGPTGSTNDASTDTKSRWVDLARAGDFRAAYSRMTAAGAGGVADIPEELLLAADVARRAGHPDQAARHLERLLGRYPKDTRADVAAFTLGRIRLQLGHPARAGQAFERVAASSGGLAEDALYRAVLAWEQAGDAGKAEHLRQRYFERYRNGRYAGALGKKP